MGDKMSVIPLKKLVNWIFAEYRQEKSIFGIREEHFYAKGNMPLGPAAGPHTQLAQNIVAAYLGGGRYFELKTVQVLDELEFPKPCIRAEDECYNTEWSTELSVENAFGEYLKAWFLLHILQKELFDGGNPPFTFNMSVGYDLEGIKSEKIDNYIEGMKDCANTPVYQECLNDLLGEIHRFKKIDAGYLKGIPARICDSITLSTLHGCPPAEIEAISAYLLAEKGLHTYVKMNPTLLGYPYVRKTLDQMGYAYISLKEASFTHDLQYDAGVAMLKRLKVFAREQGRELGVKLTNTLPVQITGGELPGEEMYMSGRALYALAVNLAAKLAQEFDGDLKISFAGGADYFNLSQIFATGIKPVTVATTLLKPGGYSRQRQLAAVLEGHVFTDDPGTRIDLTKLAELARDSIADGRYAKTRKTGDTRKIDLPLPLIDCFIAPCTRSCPIGQDVPEYSRLVGEGRFTEAYERIIEKNPLPFITGSICSHPCMAKCTRLDYDEPVRIRSLKKIAADKGWQPSRERKKKEEQSKGLPGGPRVAVIGAGPSGLAAGYFLARAKLAVTVFEQRDKPGGMVEHVIPHFRISREAIARDIELVKEAGVEFQFGVEPGFSITALKEAGYDYIYLAIGAAIPHPLQLFAGTDKVSSAVSFLQQFNQNKDSLKPGKNVAVIGGGNTAMDVAMAALKTAGTENVYIVYRRTRDYMPADREEVEGALKAGVIFKELLAPISLADGVLRCSRMELGEFDASGRRKAVARPGEVVELEVDTIISAIGEKVDGEILRQNGIELKTGSNETNLENVFIGGDALSGPSTIVEAIAHGRRVAETIISREKLELPPHHGSDPHESPNGAVTNREIKMPGVTTSETVNAGGFIFSFPTFQPSNFPTIFGRLAEIYDKKGILCQAAEPVAGAEADRCLECNYVCNICAEVCPNRANVPVRVDGGGLKNLNQIVHLDGACNECGNCATFCPYQGAPYQDKLTLYWTEEDFQSSSNNGFLLLEDGPEPVFKFRIGDRVVQEKLADKEAGSPFPDPAVLEIVRTVFYQYKYLF